MTARIMAKGCICGHDHTTARYEHVERCLECSCDGWDPRCQNCGEPRRFSEDGFDVCSRRCCLQLAYAASLAKRVAA